MVWILGWVNNTPVVFVQPPTNPIFFRSFIQMGPNHFVFFVAVISFFCLNGFQHGMGLSMYLYLAFIYISLWSEYVFLA